MVTAPKPSFTGTKAVDEACFSIYDACVLPEVYVGRISQDYSELVVNNFMFEEFCILLCTWINIWICRTMPKCMLLL